jgi:hypothetical protein
MVSALLSAALMALPMATAAGIRTPPPPIWGPVMTAPFNQSITILGFSWINTVQYYYDSTTQPVGSSLYIHSKGQHDEICTGVPGYEFSDEPCSLLASTDTWRYVIYPESKFCCRFCNTTEYCGIIAPTWLQENATYQGQRTIGGKLCNGWMKQGGESNYAFFTADSLQQPCQYYEGYPSFDIGSNYWNFTMSAFSTAPIPSATFAVPTGMGCENMCQSSEIPYEERIAEAKRRSNA